MSDSSFDRYRAELEVVEVKLSQQLRLLRWLVAVGLIGGLTLGAEILIQSDARLPRTPARAPETPR